MREPCEEPEDEDAEPEILETPVVSYEMSPKLTLDHALPLISSHCLALLQPRLGIVTMPVGLEVSALIFRRLERSAGACLAAESR